jgi:hypothetical protein
MSPDAIAAADTLYEAIHPVLTHGPCNTHQIPSILPAILEPQCVVTQEQSAQD